MNSIEWLENRIKVLIPEDIGSQLMFKSNIAKAKEMHKAEIIDAFNLGDYGDTRIAEHYYQKTFGSKGTDAKDVEKEMFDLEQETTLEEAAESLFPDSSIQKRIFIKGAKWQEEHSKSLSDKWKEYQDWLNEPPELSDEEIEKGAKEWYNKEGAYSASAIALKTWVYAIRWYREQLKTKL